MYIFFVFFSLFLNGSHTETFYFEENQPSNISQGIGTIEDPFNTIGEIPLLREINLIFLSNFTIKKFIDLSFRETVNFKYFFFFKFRVYYIIDLAHIKRKNIFFLAKMLKFLEILHQFILKICSFLG